MRRCQGNEGAGGFLESILAAMAVITASSLFLIVLSAGAVQEMEEPLNMDELIQDLRDQGFWPEGNEELDIVELECRFERGFELPEGVSGIRLTYREMGITEPVLVMGGPPEIVRDVMNERSPVLLSIDGHRVPAVVEVQAW